jgi:tetratricopeptide (TPR) repeat protein
MSGRIAKLREEKEKQKEAVETIDALSMCIYPGGSSANIPKDELAKIREEALAKAEDAYAVVKQGSDLSDLAQCLALKGRILSEQRKMNEAVAAYRTALELFAAANQKGGLSRHRYDDWVGALVRHAFFLACLGQTQEAERAYWETLERPKLMVGPKIACLQGLVRLYWKGKDWPKLREYTEKALEIFPRHDKSLLGDGRFFEAQLYLLLGNAAEGEGDDALAKEYDDKAFALWKAEGGNYSHEDYDCTFVEGIAFGGRRKALEALKQGDPAAAVKILQNAVQCYVLAIEPNGLDFVGKEMSVLPLLDAMRVFCTALLMTGERDNILFGRAVLADVQETEAIWEGYEQGVLEETRRELAEKRAAAAAAASAAAAAMQGGGGEGGGTEGVAKKKSKAAKRKQQKRKAQQKKTAAERAVSEVEDEKEEGLRGEEKEEQGKAEETVVMEDALKGLTVQDEDEKEKEEEEEVEEEECSVCLCALGEGGGRGPELLCGHSYHLSCLTFWKEKCVSKAIEPTCPYCRAPIQEK